MIKAKTNYVHSLLFSLMADHVEKRSYVFFVFNFYLYLILTKRVLENGSHGLKLKQLKLGSLTS